MTSPPPPALYVAPSRTAGDERPSTIARQLTRASNSNFFYAFLTLGRPRRDAIFAVYAFCRAVDNVVDEAEPRLAAARLDDWRREIEAAFGGEPQRPLTRQLAQVARQFELPKQFFLQVIEGVAMDLAPRRFETWPDLARYCDLVAGAVGRLAVRIFGRSDLQADQYAAALGTALQLTNILRDLGPDARLGRFYLPLEDLRRFAVSEADVLGLSPGRVTLLRFEAARARDFFESARALGRSFDPPLCAAEVMAAIYRRLLEQIERRGFPTTGPEVHLSRPRKAWVAVSTFVRCHLPLPRGAPR